MSNAIQELLREPAVTLSPDMGLGSREQNMQAPRPKQARFILSEQSEMPETALPCLEEAADL